jgi:hypothetical protein
MLMADVFSITLSVVGFLLALQGLWLVSRALWPTRVGEAAKRCRGSLWLLLLAGLPATVLMVILAVVVKRAGAGGQAGAFMVVCLWLVWANIGVAGLATHIGQRLASPADQDRPWKATVRGGTALELAYVFPILGWFGLLPLSMVIGAGAATMSLFRRKDKLAQVSPVDTTSLENQVPVGAL